MHVTVLCAVFAGNGSSDILCGIIGVAWIVFATDCDLNER
jgi:hypothetical protein